MIIVLNNKSNLTKEEFNTYQEELGRIDTNHNIVLCPSSCYISLFNLQNINLGSQDCSSYNEGAHTGEIAASQLKSLNVEYCITGHSERIIEKKETKKEIIDKINALLGHKITPIFCIGETLSEKASGKRTKVLKENIEYLIENINKESLDKIIIAYEPIWAIGTGAIPKKEELEDIFQKLRKLCPANKLLYGGSINEENIDLIRQVSEIDGYLIGGLSLKVERLKKIINQI